MRNFKSPTIAETSNHVEFIDGLRGVAVVSVVFFHSVLHHQSAFAWAGMEKFGWQFSTGVTLFFALSAYTLMLSMAARRETGDDTPFVFYARRMFRILPLWWVTCLIYYFFFGKTFEATWLSMSFLVGFVKGSASVCVSPVGWSLWVEESFYLFFPVWVQLITSTSRALVALAIVSGARLYYLSIAPITKLEAIEFPDLMFVSYPTFFIGILVWFVSNEEWYRKLTSKIFARKILDALAAASALVLLFGSKDLAGYLWGTILLVAATPGTRTRRLCSFRPLTFIGGLCYGIYLLHHVIENFGTMRLQVHLHNYFRSVLIGEVESVIACVVTLALTIPIAWISFTYFEKPIVQMGRRWLVSLRSEKP